ncbi:MAG TPA: twin-arginine translocase TatA/TatE family subunit [Myxococcaceae bacterium]|nr:twin-arginine translocase TatA/TatE family subunit [Myxococcaceae bacterium]
MGLRLPELLLIFAALLLLFGGAKLPQLGSALGSAIRNFKKGFSGEEDHKLSPSNHASAADAQAAPPQKVASKE